MNDPGQMRVFDRALVRHHRNRAANDFAHHNALFRATSEHLIERLGDVTRKFTRILDLGAHDGALAAALAREDAFVVAADVAERMIASNDPAPRIAVDEEWLPFAADSFDLIVSNLSLHWVNDLPGALAQIKRALQPGGLFLAALLGGETLHQLRACLMEAELAVSQGVSLRLSPQVDLQAATSLMRRAEFALPVIDREILTLTYPDAYALMRDLRGMGETNACLGRLKHPARRALFAEAARLYQTRYAADGRIPASFEVIFLHGWKKDLGQKAASRG